jgi:hypothetical protein
LSFSRCAVESLFQRAIDVKDRHARRSLKPCAWRARAIAARRAAGITTFLAATSFSTALSSIGDDGGAGDHLVS